MASVGIRLAAALFAVALALSGCSPAINLIPETGQNARIGTSSDINPRDPATLRDGGDLRLALTAFPPNFNILHIDGNSAEVAAMMKATLPRAFVIGPDGSTTVDTNYFTSIELTGTAPQVVTYTINPKAVWSDGTPITWEDIASQVHALSGADKNFEIAGPSGAERVASVTRGVDDRQAVMTFAKPYAEWRGMFAGNGMLLPKSMTATPEAFNKGQLDGPGPSAGPFIATSLDRTTQRIVLSRNPKWWGPRPRLDNITYLVLDDAARLPALQNNTIDATGVGTIDQLTIAQRTKGITIRRAPAPAWSHITFNGAPGSILADKALRVAVSKGIDRQTIAKVVQYGLTSDPVALGNHIYVAGQKGYQDNSAVVPYDPAAAKRELDALGWKQVGQFREKDGRPLVIRDLFYDAQGSRQFAQITQHSLAQIGVKLELVARAGSGFFTNYINVGDFDLAQFGWLGDAFPLSSLTQIYKSDGESNFGKIGSPQIDAAIERTLEELDPDRARALANDLDRLIWAEGFSLPLTQSPGDVAVRSTLANFGAAGLGDLDYTAIGFTRS
ncbi:ABC transporter family substrate-binding protein [Mycobacterium intracellulare]|uniref:Solute-binding protein family 5 domain-containing protein n=2 Tax=Mycobacterium intracellulare TaxID=1767 RepID=A0A7R7RM25_MYCIT|nr:ABC transporter family substrate-binding protein [Mycobacterium intracellulare]AFC42791.1 extracellular solute-binding protein, family protein 5 [Mycobacterium intracellulare ATCC 13950]ETZ37729.1 bacterial extracellular solute-binding s, 5 Middle family protein [Mycobacterium intracellulare MIN_061107_1834]MCA2248463.1 ABC transporter family substrate-binding protein [Mycobacterium intracellulare]MCA2272117.1 ABC transporter family substrate-binding protein [Mycobacterium intracellulare]MC